jgi:phosphate transport system protein
LLRSQFEEQLTALHNEFYEMGQAVSENISKSVKSFIDHDRKLAQEVIDNDSNINDMEIHLEKRSFELIALQQPVTSDLRTIITVMKASSDLERMGDHAVSIAKSTIHLKGETRITEVEEELGEMMGKVKHMVDAVLKAYINQDAKSARIIATWDDEVNTHMKSIRKHAIRTMQEDVETIISGNDYLHVAIYLERIGDYVTNICEWIVYLQSGKITELGSNIED